MRLSLFMNRQTEHVMSYLSNPFSSWCCFHRGGNWKFSWNLLAWGSSFEPHLGESDRFGRKTSIASSSIFSCCCNVRTMKMIHKYVEYAEEAKTLEEMSETNQSCLTKNDKVNVKRYSTTSNQFERHQRVHFVCKQLSWGLLACQQPEATMRDTKDLLLSKLHQKHFRLTRSDAPRWPVAMKASKKVTKALPPNSFA